MPVIMIVTIINVWFLIVFHCTHSLSYIHQFSVPSFISFMFIFSLIFAQFSIHHFPCHGLVVCLCLLIIFVGITEQIIIINSSWSTSEVMNSVIQLMKLSWCAWAGWNWEAMCNDDFEAAAMKLWRWYSLCTK